MQRAMRPASSGPARATLLDAVRGDAAESSSNVVDVVVRRLRQKLGGSGPAIETVRGTGYRLGG